jgi:hypothetical protein
MDLVLRNARIVGNEQVETDIGIANGRIAAIQPGLAADAESVDIGGRLVAPGLIETHVHLDKSGILDRCKAERGDLEEAIQEVARQKKLFTAEDVYSRAKRTLERSILGDIGHAGSWELEWWSIYTASTLCLDGYRHGPVFFIGDSAHIVPIFGVRGLNNGLADAHNIGWKLGLVLDGEAGAGLLDSYSPERRGATLDVFANASKSTRFMTPPTRGWKLAREAALSLTIRHEFPRDLADPRQMQPYTYAASPLTPFAERDGDFASGPINGSFAINARVAEGGFLLDRAGDGFCGLMFIAGAPARRSRCVGRARSARSPLHEHPRRAPRRERAGSGAPRPRWSRQRTLWCRTRHLLPAAAGPPRRRPLEVRRCRSDRRRPARVPRRSSTIKTMPFDELEHAYEALAEAIDRAGAEQESLFLAKLALAHQLGDLERFRQAVAMAQDDLPADAGGGPAGPQ